MMVGSCGPLIAGTNMNYLVENLQVNAQGHLTRSDGGPVVRVEAYHEARRKRDEEPQDLTAFDLAVLESFGGTKEADEAVEAKRQATVPKAAPAPVVTVDPRSLVSATKWFRALLTSPTSDTAFDRDRYAKRVREFRQRAKPIEPGRYDSVAFAVAVQQLRVDATGLTDADIDQLSMVDITLGDRARAARAGMTERVDVDEYEGFDDKPASLAALFAYVDHWERREQPYIESIRFRAMEAHARLDALEQRVATPVDDASSRVHAGEDITALKARVEFLERTRLHYEGIWSADKVYSPGSIVTDHGSLWIAHSTVTKSRPGGALDSCRAWQMIAKGGRPTNA